MIDVKQDVQSLYGLDESFFDVVIANNVIYAVQDVPPCLAKDSETLNRSALAFIRLASIRLRPRRLTRYGVPS